MFEKLNAHLKKLKQDLKPMSFSQKVDHLWSYYKEVLFTAALIALLVCVVITCVINAGTETLLYGVLGNTSCSVEGHGYLTEDFFAYKQGIERKQEVVLDSVVFEDPELTADVAVNYDASMRLLALVSAKLADYMLLDQYTMEFYIADDFYMDLRDLLPAQELEAMKSSLIYAQPEGYQEMFPVAIDVSELPFVKTHIRTEDKVYLVFAGNTQRPQTCLELWQWLKDWSPDSAA